MEEKINIAEILKDKPTNTKLYSPLFGNVYFSRIIKRSACVETLHHGTSTCFYNDATYLNYKEAETLLFPSKEMRDWNKFAWKKGDVLISNDSDEHIIFKGFSKSDYTTFEGKHWISVSKKRYVSCLKIQNVQDYHIEDNKESAQTYINTIEKRLGGKLNRESLEIEKAQTEFKDGDIAFADHGNRQDVFIVSGKTGLSEGYNSFISLDLRGLTLSMGYRTSFFKEDLCKLRLATEEEKQQLFNALAKENKAWDTEKKQIVDLKPKVELKPFDKVLIRDFKDQAWRVSLFGYKDANNYYCCNGCCWNQCIPYIGNESLLGTTKDVEG